MDVTDITFGIKDVVAIIVSTGTLLGFWFALKHAVAKNKEDIEVFKVHVREELLHEKNAKKANTEIIFTAMGKIERELKEKEDEIYDKIAEMREEHKEANGKLSGKIDAIALQMNNMSNNLSELTGYLKGRNEKIN
jgi:hypothetical protein